MVRELELILNFESFSNVDLDFFTNLNSKSKDVTWN